MGIFQRFLKILFADFLKTCRKCPLSPILGRHVGMEELESVHPQQDIDRLTAPPEDVIEKDTKESTTVYSDASDVSSNDFSGPEDGECESDEEGRKSAEFGRKSVTLLGGRILPILSDRNLFVASFHALNLFQRSRVLKSQILIICLWKTFLLTGRLVVTRRIL